MKGKNIIIDGVGIKDLSEWDRKPVKNKLPMELKERMKTEKQWLEMGYLIKKNAKGYEMHPNMMSKKLFLYYLDSQVEKMTNLNAQKNCGTCSYRENRYCFIAGDFVGVSNCCSEWVNKF